MSNYQRKAVATEAVVVPPASVSEIQNYFRVKDAAAYLHVTVSCIRLAYAKGKLPGVILGKRLIFTRPDLDRFIAAEQAKQAA